jgi:hypothetical protein
VSAFFVVPVVVPGVVPVVVPVAPATPPLPLTPEYTREIAADAIAIAAEGEIPRFVDTASPADFAIALRANSSAESKIVDEIVG